MITRSSHLGPGTDLIDIPSFLLFSVCVCGVLLEFSYMYPLNFYNNTISTIIEFYMILTKYKKGWKNQSSQMKSTVIVV